MVYHRLPSIAIHTWMVVVDRTRPKVVRPYCRNLEPFEPLQMMRMGGMGWNGGTIQFPQHSNPTENGGAIPKGRSRPVATESFGSWGSDLGATQPAAAPLCNPVDSVGGL